MFWEMLPLHPFSAPNFYTLTWQEHFHPDVVERYGNVRKRMVERREKWQKYLGWEKKKKKE
jgi:hypothetical protein